MSELPIRARGGVQLAFIGLLLATACARPATPTASLGTLSSSDPPVVIAEMGVTLDSPGDVAPLITSAQAIDIATQMFADQVVDARSVDAVYGLFTDSDFGPVVGEEGVVTPRFVRVPVWIVTFRGLSIEPIGRFVPGTDPLPGRPSAVNTEFNVVVNALTSEYMEAFTYR